MLNVIWGGGDWDVGSSDLGDGVLGKGVWPSLGLGMHIRLICWGLERNKGRG